MSSVKILLKPKKTGVSYDVLVASIANLDFDEKITWSFLNEFKDEIIMESVINLEDGKTVLNSEASGGGYESSVEIDGLGDNIGIEEALKIEYGDYKIKKIYG